jgi:GNAT superfamily N-acetyltransferase
LPIRVVAGGPDEIEGALSAYVRGGAARRGIPPSKERIDQVRTSLADGTNWFFVADDDGEPVGMAAAMPSREDFGDGALVPGLCYLDLVFVVPERWGDGIGALLLDTVLADARGRGFSRIHLLTHDDNERAHALYASRAFTKTGWTRMSRDPVNGTVSEWARDL